MVLLPGNRVVFHSLYLGNVQPFSQVNTLRKLLSNKLAPYIHRHWRFCAEKRLVVAGTVLVAIGRQRVVDEFETARSGQHWAIYGETLDLT